MTTGESSRFLAAGGILPWREGDELPEDIIRRNRGDCSKIEAERDAALAEVERLRGRVCEWRCVEDTWDEWHFEGACEGAWVAGCVGDEDTPEDCGYIYCPTCGGKIAFIDDDDCEEADDD